METDPTTPLKQNSEPDTNTTEDAVLTAGSRGQAVAAVSRDKDALDLASEVEDRIKSRVDAGGNPGVGDVKVLAFVGGRPVNPDVLTPGEVEALNEDAQSRSGYTNVVGKKSGGLSLDFFRRDPNGSEDTETKMRRQRTLLAIGGVTALVIVLAALTGGGDSAESTEAPPSSIVELGAADVEPEEDAVGRNQQDAPSQSETDTVLLGNVPVEIQGQQYGPYVCGVAEVSIADLSQNASTAELTPEAQFLVANPNFVPLLPPGVDSAAKTEAARQLLDTLRPVFMNNGQAAQYLTMVFREGQNYGLTPQELENDDIRFGELVCGVQQITPQAEDSQIIATDPNSSGISPQSSLLPKFDDFTGALQFLESPRDSSQPELVPVESIQFGISGECLGYLMDIPAENMGSQEARDDLLIANAASSVPANMRSSESIPITIADPGLFDIFEDSDYSEFWREIGNQLAQKNNAFDWYTRGFNSQQIAYFHPACDLTKS